jgi:hypothetical protein
MKTPNSMIRLTAALTMIFAMLLLGSLNSGQALARTKSFSYSNAEKHVSIKIEIHGDTEGIHQDHVEHLVAEWLEAAKLVVEHTEGANSLHLHVVINVKANHHAEVHEDCGDWHEEKEAATLDAIDEILHHMTMDFIDKFSH